MLKALTPRSSSDGQTEPWFSIWSALAHQGDVFSGSYAALPHIVEILASDPVNADSSFFQFPAWVEICRCKANEDVQEDLKAPYFEALARLPALVAAAAKANWNPDYLACCMAAIAVAKGQPIMAEAALELTPDVAKSFVAWFHEQ